MFSRFRAMLALAGVLTLAGSVHADKVPIMAKSSGQQFPVEIIVGSGPKAEKFTHLPTYPPKAKPGQAQIPDEINVGRVESGKIKLLTRVKTDGVTFTKGIPQTVTYTVMEGNKALVTFPATDEQFEVEITAKQHILVTVKPAKVTDQHTFNVQYGRTAKDLSFALVFEKPMFYDGLDAGLKAESNNMTLLASKDWGCEKVMSELAEKVADDMFDNKKVFTDTSHLGFRVLTGRDTFVKEFPDSVHGMKKADFQHRLKTDLVKCCQGMMAVRRYPVLTDKELAIWKERKYIPESFRPAMPGVVTFAQAKELAGKHLNATVVAGGGMK